jgi:hypothetical protein
MVLKAKTQSAPAPAQEEQKALTPVTQTTAITRPAGNIADLNAGILEGLDGIGSGNRISIDATDFVYKQTEARVRSLDVVISYGTKLYQYWDDNSQLCQSKDGKVSEDNILCATCEHKKLKECKFKFEIRWQEENPDSGEIDEVIFTMPTVSAVNFVDYVKKLAKEGLGVGQVITHMEIERRKSQDGKQTYSAVVFTKKGLLEEAV